MAAIGSIFRVLCLGLEYVVYRLSRLAGGRASVTQWQQRRLGQPVGKWRWGAGAGAGEEPSRALTGKHGAAMLLLLLLGVVPILHVCSEEVTVDTDACLRGAKAQHGDNPNDELDSFLACVLARLDAVSFPQSQFG